MGYVALIVIALLAMLASIIDGFTELHAKVKLLALPTNIRLGFGVARVHH
jgi:hypothetical protein